MKLDWFCTWSAESLSGWESDILATVYVVAADCQTQADFFLIFGH